jgi:hypothetical protein
MLAAILSVHQDRCLCYSEDIRSKERQIFVLSEEITEEMFTLITGKTL